jgi:hypothetical protein
VEEEQTKLTEQTELTDQMHKPFFNVVTDLMDGTDENFFVPDFFSQ